MTIISRSKLDHPTLGEAGGSGLHTTMENLYTKLGDDSNSRFFTADTLANAASVNFDHNFKTAFSELSYNLYLRNTGTGELTLITETSTPSIYQFSLVARTSFETTQVTLTNSSGSTRDIALVLFQESIATSNKLGVMKKSDTVDSKVLVSNMLMQLKPVNQSFSDFNDVFYDHHLTGLFIACVNGNTDKPIYTSKDSVNWIARTAGTAMENFQAIAGNNSILVCVCIGNPIENVMTSNNGINWTMRTSPSNSWQDVCWSNTLNLFVAVAGNLTNRVMTSSNGTSWTSGLSAQESYSWKSVCWSETLGLLVAVSDTGSVTPIMTSVNGITWVLCSALAGTITLKSVCWSKELNLFVAVGSSGASGNMIISSDGFNWSFIDTSYTYLSVSWIDDLLCFVATTNASDRFLISSDGTNWHPVVYDVNRSYSAVTFSKINKTLVAVGSGMDSRNIMSSNSPLLPATGTLYGMTKGGNVPSIKSDQSISEDYIGNFLTSNGSATAWVSATAQQGGNSGITLTSGHWLVWSRTTVVNGTSSAITQFKFGVGTQTGNNFTGSTDFTDLRPASHTPTGDQTFVSGMQRFTVSNGATQVVYPKIQITGTVGTGTVNSKIFALCIG
jgi:hypothetical protein